MTPPDFSKVTACPVTGRPVRFLAAVEGTGSSSYRAEFHRIGDDTIHARVWGYSDLNESRRYARKLTEILEASFPGNAPFHLVEDYTRHDGASVAAKAFYINYVRSRPGLRKYVFYGVKPFFRLLIKMARRLNPSLHFSVDIMEDYGATMAFLGGGIAGEAPVSGPRGSAPPIPPPHLEPEAALPPSGDEWMQVALCPGYAASFRMLGPRIVYTKPHGYSGDHGMGRFLEKREAFLRLQGLWDEPHVEIKDYGGIMGGLNRIARAEFINFIRREAVRGSLKAMVHVNSSRLVQFSIAMALRLDGSSFPMPFAANLPTAIQTAHHWLPDGPAEKAPVSTESLPRRLEAAWNYHSPTFSLHQERLGADLLRIQAVGSPHPADLEGTMAAAWKIVEAQPPLGPSHMRLYDLAEFGRPSLAFMARFMPRMRALNDRFPTERIFIYGLPRALNSFIKVYAPFYGASVSLVKNEAEALAQAAQLRNLRGQAPNLAPSREGWSVQGPSMRLEYALLEDSILLERLIGSPREEDLEAMERCRERVLASTEFPAPILGRLWDWSQLKRFPARLLRAWVVPKGRAGSERILCFGAGPWRRFLLGGRLRRWGAGVEFAADASSALARFTGAFAFPDSRFAGFEVKRSPEWEYRSPHYEMRMLRLGKDILYLEGRGEVREADLPGIFACHRRALMEIRPMAPVAYRIFNYEGVRRASFRTVRHFLSTINEQNQEFGVAFAVAYGLKGILRRLSVFSRAAIRAPFETARDLPDALRRIERFRARGAAAPAPLEAVETIPPIGEIQALLQFMGSINWELVGMDLEAIPVGEEHPMRPLYESVALLKQDFDTVFSEKSIAEAHLAQENELHRLRADCWRAVADLSDDFRSLAIRLAPRLAAPLAASRSRYYHLDGGAVVCLADSDGAPGGDRFPAAPLEAVWAGGVVRVGEKFLREHLGPGSVNGPPPLAYLIPYRPSGAPLGFFSVEFREGAGPTAQAVDFLERFTTEFHVLLNSMAARREAEEATRRANEALEARVEERTRELQGAIRDLEAAREAAVAANEAKGRFLANMSHEIRTPLNAVLGYAQALAKGAAPGEREQFGGQILAASRSLLELINQVLDLSKISAGKMETASLPFALEPLLTGVLEGFEQASRSTGVPLRLELGPDLPPSLLGDPVKLRQILVNLVGNAVKFTEKGEIVLRVRRVTAPDAGIGLRFEVEDTGPGIPPERLGSLFKPFEQADADLARRFGGTGLGTSIASELVKLLGGTLGVRSQLKRGSQFWFELPFAAAGISSRSAPAAVPDDKPSRGLKILVVEDYLPNQELAQYMLVQAGAEVTVASDGQEALERLERGARFDLCLMDVQMPRLDGLEATRRIRADARFARMPVVGMTAYAFDEDRAHCFAAGMDDVLTKPVDWDQALVSLAARARGIPSPLLGRGDKPPSVPDAAMLRILDYGTLAAQFGEQAEVPRKILGSFLAQLPVSMSELETAVGARDWALARRLSHGLRGLALNLRATETAEAALRVEESCHAGGIRNLPAYLAELRGAGDRLKAAARPLILAALGDPPPAV
ncbi:MAG: response regulator [Spirochaetes bacterium]|nr:response regulator [Spirochaetota bacterium]